MRTFSGNQQFDALKSSVIDSYKKVFPVEKNGYKMELKDIWVDDKSIDLNDFTSQKHSRLQGQTWGAPIYAHIVLKDPAGKVVDEIKEQRLATVPRLTPRGSYIVKGNEYQVNNQLRRRPGVYTVQRKSGDQFKTMVKTTGENAKDFEIHFDPLDNQYFIGKIGKDTSTIPLYPFLHALNVPDADMKSAWGDRIFEANKTKVRPHDVVKLADKLTGSRAESPEAAALALRNYVREAKVDPEMTHITLGQKFDHLHPGLLLGASKKLLHVYQGKEHPDDPESLLFKEVLSVEDMMRDKFERKHVKDLKFTLGKHLGQDNNLKKLINVQRLTNPVESFFTTDDRSSTPEQYNPVQMLSNLYKLTMTGTGGIKDPHTIPQEVREVHPSHMGFIDPVHTPESQKIGTMLHMTSVTAKEGKTIKTNVYNVKTKKMEYLSPLELYSHVVAFPEDVELKDKSVHFKKPTIRVQHNGKVDTVDTSKVEYVIPSHVGLFSYSTNLVPFLQNDQGNRVMMASKMLEQAIPLVHREAPLVQTEAVPGTTFQKFMGGLQTVKAPVDGLITKVTPDFIEIGGKTKLPIYNHFPLNQKTFIHHEPVVKVGDRVKAGQLLADSNFTKDGTLAIGKNLSVAYLPFPGLTFEDGIVITESASKKLATQQIYKSAFAVAPKKTETSAKRFLALQPTMISTAQRELYDSEGVIKKGTVVKPGQITIMGLKYELDSIENASLKRINKALQQPWTAQPVRYMGEHEGVVTDVVKRGDEVTVYVKATEPAKESDKLSGVHGNKGVITRVIPDHEAPRTKDGHIPDVFLNPHGIIGRINMGQLYESAAAKIAKKTGKTYVVKNFSSEPTDKKITAEMKAHGIDDMEEMILPNGKSIGKVSVGNPYILRLAKTGKSGFSARMPGTGYDQNMQPVKGGEEGTKSMDLMTFYSMLSHGAKKNLMDAHQKSEMNEEYWRALEMGRVLPAPKTTFAFGKFINLLKGAGINPVKEGADIALGPMTDAEVKKLSNGKITEFNFLLGKDLSPKKNGFFDPGITGGTFGERFSHMDLPEAMPNPIFERAIKTLTGLDAKKYSDVVSGVLHVAPNGALSSTAVAGSKTGGPGVAHLLSKINVDEEITDLKRKLRTAKENELNTLNQKLRYLTALKELNMKPQEAYMRKLIPVIPPIHRPVYDMPGKGLVVAPANYLYQRLGVLSQSHDYPVMKLLSDEEKKNLRADTYKATREIAGLEPVLTRGKDVPIEGFISQITGNSPKTGFFLQKVISKRQDLVGRGVITAAPDLSVDELGIPEKMAWKIFHPFIMREYSLAGIPPLTARKEIEDKAPRAKNMLQAAMNKRTVLMNRAPSLHKFSIMAFKPKMSEGLAVRVPPLVLKGFGGDYDGDAVTIHVPTSEEALRESHKMFPSNNLFKPGTGELMIMPSQESAIGLYFLSKTAAGRAKINAILPKTYHISDTMDAKAATTLYNRIAKEDPKAFKTLVMNLKDLGDKTAYESGFSVGIKDVIVDRGPRDRAFAEADKTVAALKRNHKPGPELDLKIADIYKHAAEAGYAIIKKSLAGTNNGFYDMVTSGARGKDTQLMQIMSAPGVMKDAKDRSMPTPVKRSYAEGLSPSDYFIAAYGVRKGMMDRALQTSQPGALNKDIMVSAIDNIITESDCGTKKGILMPITSRDVQERYLAQNQDGFSRNTLMTPQVISQMMKKGVKQVLVRSPLECLAKKGTCAHCYGLDDHGHIPELGDNVGATSGQAMSEPMTQMTMKCSSGHVVDSSGQAWPFVDFYESKTSDELYDGLCYSKHGEFLIRDRGESILSKTIQTHPPEDRMLFIKTKNGHTLVTQANHPLWVYTADGDAHEKPASQLTINDRLLVDNTHLNGEESAPFMPYILGLFLAEGATRYGNGTPKYEGVPVASIITQNNNSIKEKAWDLLKDLQGARLHEKDIQIYNPRFAAELAGYVRGREAKLKRLMPGFNKWKNTDLAQLLAGWIDGDGTVFCRNRTVAKIHTGSYYALQQLEMICFKLGITFSPQALKYREGQKAQQFTAELRFRDNAVYRHSIKMQQCEFRETTRIIHHDTLDHVVQTKEIWVWDMPVWDIKTETCGFTCGMLRNHNTFHTGGIASGGSIASGFTRLQQLLKMPKDLAGEATMAQKAGKITKISPSPAGGHEIFIDNVLHPVRPGLPLKVKVGDTVKPGDVLSEGVIKPQNLVKYKGMRAAQQYIVDEMKKVYDDQLKENPIKRKNLETVVRSFGNMTRVIHAPKQSDFAVGDLIPFTTAEEYNEHRSLLSHDVNDAPGYHLRKAVGKLPEHHPITDKDVPYLKALGYNQVDVVKEPLKHAPILKSIERLPMEKKNWMGQIGYRYIKDTLTTGAAERWKSNVEGNHPIPAFAYGVNFGKKKEHY